MKLKIYTVAGKRCLILSLFLMYSITALCQTPMFSDILVSDTGVNNSIGRANTSRNLAIDENGTLYVAFNGSEGIRVAKSLDRGANFLPSVSVSQSSFEPEIIINDTGTIFVAWMERGTIYIAKSTDSGLTFSVPILVGSGSGEAVHMATFQNKIYLVDQSGSAIYLNEMEGEGEFLKTEMRGYVYADIRTDQNGTVFFPTDDPVLYLFKSNDFGLNYSQVTLNPPGQVFYSSYALSDGPCGTFIFVGGGSPTETDGYKINVSDGTMTKIVLGNNSGNDEGRTLYADNRGTLIDGYRSLNGDLMMNVSYDQGGNFDLPITIAKGTSHNITRNPFYDDIDVVYEKEGQIYISVYSDLLKNIRITQEEFPSLCAGDSFDLGFRLSGSFDPETLFSVYLSDSAGSFENKTLIATSIANEKGDIRATIPDGAVSSDAYRIQIESEENCVQSDNVRLAVGTLQLKQPSPIKACGDNMNGIFEFFDTSGIENEVLNGLAGMKVEYFDGNGNQLPSPLPNPYKNLVPYNDEIRIRVTKPSTSCFSETVLVLEVNDIPTINTLDTLYNCDLGGGFSDFDTSRIEAHLIGSNSDLVVSYSDSSGKPLPSPLPKIYRNQTAWSETIEVKVANSHNPSCYVETSFDLVVNRFPDINLEKENFICALDTSFYIATDPIFDDWQWYFEDGTLVSDTFEAELRAEGQYMLKVGKTFNGHYCEKEFSFNLSRSQLPTISNIKFTELMDENFIEIQATGDGDFEYSIDGTNFQEDALFRDVLGGVYNATVRDKNGCGEFTKEVVIVNYPKFFTPNNDGANDYWQVDGIEKYPNAIVYIFDRYGKLLRQMRFDEIGWDGMLNGVPLLSADYWFRVDLDNNKNFDGHFALKR